MFFYIFILINKYFNFVIIVYHVDS